MPMNIKRQNYIKRLVTFVFLEWKERFWGFFCCLVLKNDSTIMLWPPKVNNVWPYVALEKFQIIVWWGKTVIRPFTCQLEDSLAINRILCCFPYLYIFLNLLLCFALQIWTLVLIIFELATIYANLTFNFV